MQHDIGTSSVTIVARIVAMACNKPIGGCRCEAPMFKQASCYRLLEREDVDSIWVRFRQSVSRGQGLSSSADVALSSHG